MTRNRNDPNGNMTRDLRGVIATLTDGTVIHRVGKRQDALREIAAVCDERGVKVRTVSTPATIMKDLQGHRATNGDTELALPEPNALGRIGRLDLCDWRGIAPRGNPTQADA